MLRKSVLISVLSALITSAGAAHADEPGLQRPIQVQPIEIQPILIQPMPIPPGSAPVAIPANSAASAVQRSLPGAPGEIRPIVVQPIEVPPGSAPIAIPAKNATKALQPATPVSAQVVDPPPAADTRVLLPIAQDYIDAGAGKGMPYSTLPSGLFDENPYSINFRDGVGFRTNDGFFSLKINSLLQIDYRDFAHTAGDVHTITSLHDNFAMPRIRLFFRGNVSEFVEYATSLTTGVSPNAAGNVPAPTNLLDAYLDFNPFGAEFKEFLQIRIGRFKTPYGYQFYKISPQDFVTPELSMFTTNWLQNWETGAMAHGELFGKRFEYAAGFFNGVPNSFEVPQNNRQAIFFGAVTPFRDMQDSPLQHLTVAASYAVGHQFGNALPNALGTTVSSNGPPDNQIISPIFLLFDPNAVQNGFHELFALDVLWTYHSLNFYGEYNSGRQDYGLLTKPGKTVPVSLSGYSAAVTYFFTGEEISQLRSRLKPIQPYSWSGGTWGAFEGFARYSHLAMGTNLLQNDLVVGKGNANEVHATDIGVHWYLNEYVKISFDWQHSVFNHPISLAHGVEGARTISAEDLFWLRFQLYY